MHFDFNYFWKKINKYLVITQHNIFKYKKCKFLPRIVIKGIYRYI